jgi:hypothetical protein
MSQSATTIVAAALIGGLIALSIMLTNHWTLIPGPVLLNRWTGVVVACEWDAKGRGAALPAADDAAVNLAAGAPRRARATERMATPCGGLTAGYHRSAGEGRHPAWMRSTG